MSYPMVTSLLSLGKLSKAWINGLRNDMRRLERGVVTLEKWVRKAQDEGSDDGNEKWKCIM